jgi:hypothetical protein
MPRIDDSGGPLNAITVDVSGLDRFAGSVEVTVNANYAPYATELMRVYSVGAHFGIGHASPDVVAARMKYTECLRGAVDQLAGYANAAAVLVDAARSVAARYRDTDALAASTSAEVEQALSVAMRAAHTVLPGPAESAGSPGAVGRSIGMHSE